MKKHSLISALSIAALLAAGVAIAQQSGVKSLRGAEIDEPVVVDPVHKQQDHGRYTRNYRQQPPLIPHSTAQYQIDLNTNQCLTCHDWTKAGDRGAPTLSMTHYLGRNGEQLDSVAGTRWFCNQCHVPQVDAPALVDNTFVPSN
ncbi:Periplasmic nitrate reductase, electron transfer subunit precursor [Pelagimonas phthalicica]|uniref:Periplasmic nitrate reductase, electron transfer subunit n=1 Tax=Pelagimonas phthalicica TaxID=1037362 RepID=A0A238J9V7_9RHOB|nr:MULTISPECIES: nitrate reductase cytochrome c-type subunit [Roseobacteraceae]MBO9465347.1 nitrate reductase cytochrome c-type subunit [Tropicibacter sp. R15_0]TDS94027.1 periplasmic nitrate reductase subunit NapB [Pelagimonas phthalicica]SMX27448.1 Periplasmic nitrate reductase, electron transfer subunit precursor [Pelagimonas phthalicica]